MKNAIFIANYAKYKDKIDPLLGDIDKTIILNRSNAIVQLSKECDRKALLKHAKEELSKDKIDDKLQPVLGYKQVGVNQIEVQLPGMTRFFDSVEEKKIA